MTEPAEGTSEAQAKAPRAPEDVQKEYEALAAQVGHKTYLQAILAQEIPQGHQRMLELNQEIQKLKAAQA